MSVQIREEMRPERRAQICDEILRALPDWFGVESSIQEYVRDVREMPFFAAFADELPAGFVAVKTHNQYTAEVCVMGVLRRHHRQGIGRRLIERCEAYVQSRGMEYLTVKTLAESHPDPGYARTRAFYCAMGFRPLEIFPLLWDEANPCLLMVKRIG